MTNKNVSTVYAWQFDFGLAQYARASKYELEMNPKPSPEAKIVKCIMLTYGEYLKLKRGVKWVRKI
jgi:hypothetical protein